MTRKDKARIKILEDKIAQGDLDAMFEYACRYHSEFPNEVTADIAARMVECYEKCLDAGNLTAALNLGAMYYGGEFIPRDFKKAFKYYQLATNSDDDETYVRAWCNLGYCYYYGRDIPVDDEKAFNCYLRGAILSDANCLYKLGDMYHFGRFVRADENLASFLYQQAMDFTCEGDFCYSDICWRVGECYLHGIGVERDAAKALELLEDAEFYTHKKIEERDPFAATVLPKIQELLGEARREIGKQKSGNLHSRQGRQRG